MLDTIAKALGAIGLVVIIWGISIKSRKYRNLFFVFGGIGLLIYSIYLKDPIFIPLQIVFILAGLFEIYKLSKKK